MQKKLILKNIASLGIMQAANALIPLLVVPFVVRALGVEAFGKVTYAQTIVAYFSLLVNYGFEYSATQDVALLRENSDKVRIVFWSVIKSKIALLMCACMLFGLLLLYIPKMANDAPLYWCAFLINVGMAFSPTWFFQGMEQMGVVAIANVAMKFLTAIITLWVVVAPPDYGLYALLLSLSYCGAGIGLFIYAYYKYDLQYVKSYDAASLKKGFPIFINNLFSNIYALGGMTIIGFYLIDEEIGLYAGAHKIVMAMNMMLSMPLSMALFPALSRDFSQSQAKGWTTLKRCLLLILGIGILFTITLYFTSPIVVELLLGNKFTETIPLLQGLSVIPMLVVLATMLTVQGMYGMQLQRYAPYVGLAVATSSLCLYFILIPLMGLNGAVLGYIFSEVLEILIVFGVLHKHLGRNKITTRL